MISQYKELEIKMDRRIASGMSEKIQPSEKMMWDCKEKEEPKKKFPPWDFTM